MAEIQSGSGPFKATLEIIISRNKLAVEVTASTLDELFEKIEHVAARIKNRYANAQVDIIETDD